MNESVFPAFALRRALSCFKPQPVPSHNMFPKRKPIPIQWKTFQLRLSASILSYRGLEIERESSVVDPARDKSTGKFSNRCQLTLKVLRASQREEGLKEPAESFMVATERKKQETQKISNQKNLHRELNRSCVATHRRGGGEVGVTLVTSPSYLLKSNSWSESVKIVTALVWLCADS